MKLQPVDKDLISFGDSPIPDSLTLNSQPFFFKNVLKQQESSDEIMAGSNSIPSNEFYQLQLMEGDSFGKEEQKAPSSIKDMEKMESK